MKILLVGEYSSVHTELASALKIKGHQVLTVSDGDGYKGFAADIKCINKKRNFGKISSLINILSDYFGASGIFNFIPFWVKNKNKMKDFDVVQLINPIALSGFGSLVNLFFVWYLNRHNKNIFLCAVGDDYFWVKYTASNNTKFIGLNGGLLAKFKMSYSYKYIYGFLYKQLNNYILKISKNVIPGAYDYITPYSFNNKITHLIPFPIKTKTLNVSNDQSIISNKIVLFNGWQKGKERRKGNDVFHEVANQLLIDYPDKFDYIIVQNKTFIEYLKLINKADIFFDQCYSYDKGVNALLAMSLGKVVISGFEKEALKCYPNPEIHKEIGVNAIADHKYLYEKILQISNDTKRMKEIGKNAYEFVINNHDNNLIADLYLKVWERSL